MSEFAAPVPHRDAAALVEARLSGSPCLAWSGCAAFQPTPCERALTAGRVVGKEYVRAMVAFLTNDLAAFAVRHRL
jgi:hypothetical protein